MTSNIDLQERRFARRVRMALDQSTEDLDQATLARLAAARHAALARKKPEPLARPVLGLSFAGGPAGRHSAHQTLPSARRGARQRWRWITALLALAALLAGVSHIENEQRIAELTRLDAQMLSDALPPEAYLDHGFNVYLSRSP